MKTLRKGCRGSEVKTLQGYLNLIQDGIFGVLTEESVKEFQSSNGLTADGVVGPATWAELIKVTTKLSKRRIDYIVVHCAATKEGQNFTVNDIRRWHTAPKPQGRGWSDIGYHYVIYLDGSVHVGRDVDLIGAHVKNYNAHSIGICYVGGTDKSGKAKDTRTTAQKAALLKLLKELRAKYPKAIIQGHRDFPGVAKACPSFDAKSEYKNI